MSISTTRGDGGTTQFGAGRVSKGSLEAEALGALDEFGAAMGFARALCPVPSICDRVERLQRALFTVAAQLGAPPEQRDASAREELSKLLDEVTAEVHRLEAREGMLRDWALPGGHAAAAAMDVARTACRRAERTVVRLSEAAGSRMPVRLALLNRMSDVIWLYGRIIETDAGVSGALRPPRPGRKRS